MTKSKKRGLLAAGIVLAVLLIAALCAWLIWGNVKLINFSNTWSINHALAADPNAPITILAEADYKDKKFILYTDPIDESENTVHDAHFQKQPGFPNSYIHSGGGSSTNNPVLQIDPVDDDSNTYFVYYDYDLEPTTWSVFALDYATGTATAKLGEIETPTGPFVMVETFEMSMLSGDCALVGYEGSCTLEQVNTFLGQYAQVEKE